MYRLIRFEIKKSTTTAKGKTISLLDFTVIITEEGRPELEFYRKKAKKPMFIHYKSAIPKQAKYNAIRKERNLIDQKCCAQSAKHKHQLDFTHIPYSLTNTRLTGYKTPNYNHACAQHAVDNQTITSTGYILVPLMYLMQ